MRRVRCIWMCQEMLRERIILLDVVVFVTYNFQFLSVACALHRRKKVRVWLIQPVKRFWRSASLPSNLKRLRSITNCMSKHSRWVKRDLRKRWSTTTRVSLTNRKKTLRCLLSSKDKAVESNRANSNLSMTSFLWADLLKNNSISNRTRKAM